MFPWLESYQTYFVIVNQIKYLIGSLCRRNKYLLPYGIQYVKYDFKKNVLKEGPQGPQKQSSLKSLKIPPPPLHLKTRECTM